MTLAVILLISVVSTASPTMAWEKLGDQSAPATGAPSAQDQTAAPSQSPATDARQSSPSSSPAKPAAGQSHPPAKKPVHKKKVVAAGCDSAPAPANSAPSASNPAAAQAEPATGNAPAQNSGTASPPKNCPPSKIIVRHGGTAEPSIQLAGGPGGDEASQERVATNQMLDATETNLKRMASQQLSPNQQAGVTQIREFMEQSRTALAAGDMQRARTLAWKAKLLSDDLVKPQQ